MRRRLRRFLLWRRSYAAIDAPGQHAEQDGRAAEEHDRSPDPIKGNLEHEIQPARDERQRQHDNGHSDRKDGKNDFVRLQIHGHQIGLQAGRGKHVNARLTAAFAAPVVPFPANSL